jgi:Rrf2 family iron-sulfur cluster assembly transcriptional regulator
MRLERASGYALISLMYLANRDEPGPAQMQQISEVTGIPTEYLRKLLGRLARARLVSSMRGRRGGYRLGRDAQQITLLQIVEAMEGPVDEASVMEQDLIDNNANGDGRRLKRWRKGLADQFRNALGETTLADVMGR